MFSFVPKRAIDPDQNIEIGRLWMPVCESDGISTDPLRSVLLKKKRHNGEGNTFMLQLNMYKFRNVFSSYLSFINQTNPMGMLQIFVDVFLDLPQ